MTNQKNKKEPTTMTVYTTTISTTPADFNGNTTSSSVSGQFNDGHHASSDDFVDNGVTVIDGKTGDRKSVYTATDLDPSDIVNVSGIPMTVAQAKSVGYSFDGSEPIPEVEGTQITNDPETPPLDLRDEGAVTDGEAAAMGNVIDAVRLHTGMDQEATLELGKDILTGQLANEEEVWASLGSRGISQDAARASVGTVVQAGQSAAMRELGDAGYRELSYLADNSAAIKAVVIDHGIKRMTGKAKGVTWKHVLTLARQFARA
jgi:hypothetical protein